MNTRTYRSITRFIQCLALLCDTFGCVKAQQKSPAQDYLAVVRSFADSLLRNGIDRFGPRQTAMWAAIVDTRTGAVPQRGVPSVAGTRASDRALGGSNLYHDVATIRAFRVLSQLSGDPRYTRADDAYLTDALRYTTSPTNGLLGWGEHLFYDLYQDRVRVDSAYGTNKDGHMHHEFLVDTPPWPSLWTLDSARTAAAIQGLRHHFNDAETENFLFNRHAFWDKTDYQPVGTSQPWIKHSGLYAYSYAFLYRKTGDPEARRRAEGSGSLYWNHRNPETSLTLSCIGDKRVNARQFNLAGTTHLAYYLLKASGWVPEARFRERAVEMLKTAQKYAWDEKQKTYVTGMMPDGQPLPEGNEPLRAWVAGYGTSNLLEVGRLAAYFARTLDDPDFLTMAERCAQTAQRETPPEILVADNLGDAIHLNADLYDLTGKDTYRQAAEQYGQLALKHLWRNGWLVRLTNDPYYEAKLGEGNVALGLLRLYIYTLPEAQRGEFRDFDWSK